jgi:membrane associated rhomboid family serine protease
VAQLWGSLILLISGVGFALYFLNPELYWYAGLSGALYGLFIIGSIYSLIDKDYITGLSILIIIPAKIIWDHLHNTGQANADLIGVPVSTDSHLYGIATAFFIGLLIVFDHFRKTRTLEVR